MRAQLEAAALAGMVTFVAGCAEAPPDAGANPLPGDPNHIVLPTSFPSPTAVRIEPSPTPTRTPLPSTATPIPPPEIIPNISWKSSTAEKMPLKTGYPATWTTAEGRITSLNRLLGMSAEMIGDYHLYNNEPITDRPHSTAIVFIASKKESWVTLDDIVKNRKDELAKNRDIVGDIISFELPMIDGIPIKALKYRTNNTSYLTGGFIPASGLSGWMIEAIAVKGDTKWTITFVTAKPDVGREEELLKGTIRRSQLF